MGQMDFFMIRPKVDSGGGPDVQDPDSASGEAEEHRVLSSLTEFRPHGVATGGVKWEDGAGPESDPVGKGEEHG